MKTAIVVDKNYGSITLGELDALQAALKKENIELRLEHFQTEEEIIEHCKDADAILGTGNPPITEYVMKNLPQLKLVQRFGIGVNSIDLKAATALGKTILYMPGFSVDELAVHAASLILGLLRNTAYYDRHIRNGEWPKATYYPPKAPADLCLGLYGFGGSARPLYHLFCHGFGSRILACDPYVSETVKKEYSDVEFVEFDALLREADIVSIHVPLNSETHHIFNRDAFVRMKNDAMLINIARGSIVKEDDLIWALENGEIGFAGLDVFEKEPISNENPLMRMDNVLLTCHSAFYGVNSKKRQLVWAKELVTNALNRGIVPRKFVANPNVMEENGEFQFV